ncbi:radical SAM protein [uncultured Eubacterium sp.]|uniref:radical SAM protein n=1 Tax=uncultured Eubacterium sp. TaxID=165185 RepID=UPI0025939057|nr:radical SAM protein [uncultured Eubacterium sp.]
MNEYIKNLNRIEFVVTLACTGKCIHCSEGDHMNCTGHIDADIAVKSIHEVCKEYKIESLMTFGGEPLMYPEVVARIHKAATEEGIPKRHIITNGYFSKDKIRIEEVANMLDESGVQKILLSVDAFHQETIPIDIVKYFAQCILDTNISLKVQPAWLVSKENDNPYNVKTRELLGKFSEMGIEVASGNVIFPSGNALKYLGDYFDENKEYINPYDEDPMDIKTICFNPNGEVLDGNVYEKDIIEIIKEYRQ